MRIVPFQSEEDNRAIGIGDGDCVAVGFYGERAATQEFGGVSEIGNSKYDDGFRCRSRGFQFYFIAGVSGKGHAVRVLGGYVPEPQLGCVEVVFRVNILHGDDSAHQMTGNAAVA